jgi:ABC-type dipeptide/oligopeptide/nickel transport system permease subunit
MALAPELLAQPSETALKTRNDSFSARLARHPLARVGGALVVLLLLVAFLAPVISSLDPSQSRPAGLGTLGEAHAPGGGFLLGADTLGRDVWTRTLYGSRISLIVGIFAMTTAVFIGTTMGLLAGYFGGWVDALIMRCIEIVQSLPTILLAIALVAVLPDEPISFGQHQIDRKLFNLLLAIGLVTWTGIARAVRGQTLSLREHEFIEAARAVGCGHATILWRHLLPNVLPTVIVLATLATAHNILLEAGLSYLGLGVDPSIPSWGAMISEGQPYILSAPWIILAPGCAVALAVVAFNLLGTAMQETLDPRR